MLIQTKKGIYHYNSIEKSKVGSQWVLVGVGQDKSLVNLCDYKDDEEIVDQYLYYIASELNTGVEDGVSEKVINLSKIDDVEITDFCLIAYTRFGKQCVAIEPNYVGYDGETSILNRMIRKVEASGCIVTNACIIITHIDRLVIKEYERSNLYSVDFILMRNGYDKRVLDYIQSFSISKIPFRFEYQQRNNKVLINKR